MDIVAGARNPYPHGPEMFEDNAHVGRFAEDAHIGQHAVVDKVVGTVTVAAVFLAFELAPLRFLNFTRNGSDDDIALKPHTGALQRFNSVRVADERAFHVVDAESVNEPVFDNGMWLVAEAG